CLWCYTLRADALLQLGLWGNALEAIDEGLRIGAPTSQVHFLSLLRSAKAALHAEAFDFAGAAAIARDELQGEPTADIAIQTAMLQLAFALIGLGQLNEAYAAFTAPYLVQAAAGPTMAWAEKVRVRQGLAQVWLGRGDLDRARAEAEAFAALAA